MTGSEDRPSELLPFDSSPVISGVISFGAEAASTCSAFLSSLSLFPDSLIFDCVTELLVVAFILVLDTGFLTDECLSKRAFASRRGETWFD